MIEAAPGGKGPYMAVPVGERTSYYVQPVVQRIPGVIEGEAMKVLSKTGGNPQEQDTTSQQSPVREQAALSR